MSSSHVSSKKTRTFRARVLFPAGASFPLMSDPPHPNSSELWMDLRNFKHVLPHDVERDLLLENDVPPSFFSNDSLFDETTSKILIERSKTVTYAAQVGTSQVYNEAQWKQEVHSKALSGIANDTVALILEEDWPAITLQSDAILQSNRPDYSIAFPIHRHSPLSMSQLVASTRSGADPFLNNAMTFAFPVAVAESKSNLGSLFEAENQCAESSIKMLHKLSSLGNGTARLPVVGIALVGSFFTIYIASLELDGSDVIYKIHKTWSGDVSYLWSSLQFQIILWKLARWIQGNALAKIREEILRMLELGER